MSHIRKKAVAGLKVGDMFTISRTFTQADVTQFAAISRDYNPVHFDARFTRVKGFKGPICHGLLIGSLLTEVGGQIGWLASGMAFKFKRPVYIGETVTCQFTLTELDEHGHASAEVVFRNEAGRIVLEAALTGIVPGAQEKEVMQKMITEGDPTNKIAQ